ncbi:hypothetical protein F5X96DRAFT_689890 [Biscogniauxia mediterranea]|nr:hypothetical protein F5X96DRAFT_689890 [Biscogniauxia mediterranea]
MATQDFIEWATKVYLPQAVPFMKHSVVQWSVIPPHFREPFCQQLKDMHRPTWTVPGYGIVHTYYLRSHGDMKGMMEEPKWTELEEHAQKLCNQSVDHPVNGHEIIQFVDNYVNDTSAPGSG